MATLSYVHGASETPLIGETIGVYFDRAVERYGERDALVVRHQQHPLELARARRRADAFAAGLLALGPGARRAHRHLVAQQRRMGADPVRRRQGRADPGHHQPGLSAHRARIHAEQGRGEGAGRRRRASRPATMSAWSRPGAGARRPRPGELRAARLPTLRRVIKIGGDDAGLARLRRRRRPWRRRRARSGSRQLAATLQFDDPINIQFTSGTTGLPKGATLTHRNILNNGYFVGWRCSCTASDRLCIPVPLYHCFGMVMGNLAA